MHRSIRALAAASVVASLGLVAGVAHADPISVLFIGNSFTYGDAAGGPNLVQPYKANTVTDLNNEGKGGVPALFKAFTVQKGLDYAVTLETIPGVGLDTHYNTKLPLLDKAWDHVVLQSYSTLDGGNPGNPAKLIQYTGLFANVFTAKNPNVDIHLDATWSRADQTYLPTGHWYGQDINAMWQDVEAGYLAAKAATPVVDDVIRTGRAWGEAWMAGFADDNPYDGVSTGVNLWAPDSYHASVFGYYLEALMFFGSITDLDPTTLGYEQVAMDLGISQSQAAFLQGFASQALAFGTPEPEVLALLGIGAIGFLLSARRRRVAATA